MFKQTFKKIYIKNIMTTQFRNNEHKNIKTKRRR